MGMQTNKAYIAVDNTMPLLFGTMTNDQDVAFASELMRLTQGGNLGVGTANAFNRLSI